MGDSPYGVGRERSRGRRPCFRTECFVELSVAGLDLDQLHGHDRVGVMDIGLGCGEGRLLCRGGVMRVAGPGS